MSLNTIDGGTHTTRLHHTNDTTRARVIAAARRAISEEAVDRHPGARNADPANPNTALLAAHQERAEILAMLGLGPDPDGITPPAETPRVSVVEAQRVIATIGTPANTDGPAPGDRSQGDLSWQETAACRDTPTEMFFPVGTSGPALLKVEQAKTVCRRCPVADQCLAWALEHQEYGVAGGLSEDERRELRRPILAEVA